MNQDTIWQLIRYGLIATGSFLVSKGYFSEADVTTIIGAICAVFPILWGLYVKANTKAVPSSVADKPSIPTVSGATGAVSK